MLSRVFSRLPSVNFIFAALNLLLVFLLWDLIVLQQGQGTDNIQISDETEDKLVQHKNSKHTSGVLQQYIYSTEEHEVQQQMRWPPQSPDLNITESVWDYMRQK